jgi:hypothetical protein
MGIQIASKNFHITLAAVATLRIGKTRSKFHIFECFLLGLQ